MAFAVLTPVSWAKEASTLDPENETERAELIKILKKAENKAEATVAAKRLAEGDYLDSLREVLRATDDKVAMQAIAGTRDTRLLPAFAERLRKEPTNARLAQSLANMKSSEVATALLEVVSRNPDDGKYDQELALESALASLRANQARSALPVVRKRFEACDPDTKLYLKVNFALTMFWLGDAEGIPFLKDLLESGRKASHKVWTFETLASLLKDHAIEEGGKIPDLGALSPLLPALVQEASDRRARFFQSSNEILTRLTLDSRARGLADPVWEAWYKKHSKVHTDYSNPLHRAVQESARIFHQGLRDAAKTDKRLAPIVEHSDPVLNSGLVKSGLLHRMSSRAPDPTNELSAITVVFSLERMIKQGGRRGSSLAYIREFPSLNITLSLWSRTGVAELDKTLIELAQKAEAPLDKYAKTLQKEKQPGPAAKADPGRNRLEEKKRKGEEEKHAKRGDPRPESQSLAQSDSNRAAVKVAGSMTIAPFQPDVPLWGHTNRYRWTKIPKAFRENFFFTQFTTSQQGLTEFEVRSDGRVYLAVTSRWGGGGNSSGGWAQELTSREELLAEGWRKVAVADEEPGKTSHHYHWIIFERNCRKGERFRLRTEKYCAPILLF